MNAMKTRRTSTRFVLTFLFSAGLLGCVGEEKPCTVLVEEGANLVNDSSMIWLHLGLGILGVDALKEGDTEAVVCLSLALEYGSLAKESGNRALEYGDWVEMYREMATRAAIESVTGSTLLGRVKRSEAEYDSLAEVNVNRAEEYGNLADAYTALSDAYTVFCRRNL